jgi:hypothetical protein
MVMGEGLNLGRVPQSCLVLEIAIGIARQRVPQALRRRIPGRNARLIFEPPSRRPRNLRINPSIRQNHAQQAVLDASISAANETAVMDVVLY